MQKENLDAAPLVSISRIIRAPRELVWEMWVNEDHLSQWWGPTHFTNPVVEWKAKPGKNIFIKMKAPDGTIYPMDGDFLEIVKPERLVFISAALDDKNNRMFEMLNTIVFTDMGKTTKLDITCKPLMATEEAKQFLAGATPGWIQTVDKLEKFIEQALKEGSAISDDGPFIIERLLNAPVEKVWTALTDKEQMKKWYFDIAEFEPKIGFEFRFSGQDKGKIFWHRCLITEIIPRQKLSYSWRYEEYPGSSIVTIDLFNEGEHQTLLRLTHRGLESFPQDNPSFARSSFAKGWNHIIGKSLPAFVE